MKKIRVCPIPEVVGRTDEERNNNNCIGEKCRYYPNGCVNNQLIDKFLKMTYEPSLSNNPKTDWIEENE